MTALQLALKRYAQRSQFHDQPLLDAIIKAVREEERKNIEKLGRPAPETLNMPPAFSGDDRD